MPIILRLDIDKPYGRSNLPSKVFSKVRENFYFPRLNALGYLKDLGDFLGLLNELKIPSISYHRLCTIPNGRVIKLLMEGGHEFGLHAENTRSKETLNEEFKQLSALVPQLKIHSFTKHGHDMKLGRRHYAPYEPEKYREWAQDLGVPFFFGNGIAESAQAFNVQDGFFPDMFWIEPHYRSPNFNRIDQALERARSGTLVLLVHPENMKAIKEVRDEFADLVRKAKGQNIPFVTTVP